MKIKKILIYYIIIALSFPEPVRFFMDLSIHDPILPLFCQLLLQESIQNAEYLLQYSAFLWKTFSAY